MVTRVRESGEPKPGVARRGVGLSLEILALISAQHFPSADLKGFHGVCSHHRRRTSSRTPFPCGAAAQFAHQAAPSSDLHGNDPAASGLRANGCGQQESWPPGPSNLGCPDRCGDHHRHPRPAVAQWCGRRLHLRSRPAGSSTRIDHRRPRLGPAADRRLAHLTAPRARSHAQNVANSGEPGPDHGRHRWTDRLGVDVVRSAPPGDRCLHRRRGPGGQGWPLQHPADGRRCREEPRGPSTRQHDRGQRRRRDRPNGADQLAAQPGAGAVPRAVADARDLPPGLLLL